MQARQLVRAEAVLLRIEPCDQRVGITIVVPGRDLG
jgi:hypothetical protein